MENVIEIFMQEDSNDVEIKVEPGTIESLLTDLKESPKSSELSDFEEDNKESLRSLTKRRIPINDEFPNKRMYFQKYRKEWESIPAYKPWLSESVLGNLYFYCKFCKNNNRCGRTEIEKHMLCMKHLRNANVPPNHVLKKFNFSGLLCPVFTAFSSKDNDINYLRIARYAKYLLASGVKGILINDVLGEGMSLTALERMRITDEWIKICEKTKQHLMVQIGGAPLKEVLEMARHAERKKVGSIVVLPDLYNRPRDHFELMRYVKIVADAASTVPLLYHHNPTYTSVDIDMSKFLNDVIGEINSFAGIIFSDNNLNNARLALQVNKDKFKVFIGTDEIMVSALITGFTSFLTNSLNFLPQIVQDLYQSYKTNDIEEAQRLQEIINGYLDSIYRYGEGVPALKTAMHLMTPVQVGTVREPLVPVWQAKANKMRLDLLQHNSLP